MSIERKDKESLNKIIVKISKLIEDLENIPSDPRVLDLLEVCASLLEQQIEMDIVFEQLDEDSEEDIILNLEDGTPSSKELEEWFNLGE